MNGQLADQVATVNMKGTRMHLLEQKDIWKRERVLQYMLGIHMEARCVWATKEKELCVLIDKTLENSL